MSTLYQVVRVLHFICISLAKICDGVLSSETLRIFSESRTTRSPFKPKGRVPASPDRLARYAEGRRTRIRAQNSGIEGKHECLTRRIQACRLYGSTPSLWEADVT